TQLCTGCHITKEISEFIRCDKSGSEYEHSTCNKCSERRKNKKKDVNLSPISVKKAKLLKTGLSTDVSEHILSNVNDDNVSEDHEEVITEGTNSASDIENIYYDNDDSGLLYSIDEIEEYINAKFYNLESKNDPIKFALEIELDSQLAGYITFNLQSESLDLESIKDNFRQLSKIIIIAI
ncbi:14684_t:CDS:1, partial [Racocetra fulgida]